MTLLTRSKRFEVYVQPSVRIDVRSDHSRHLRARRLGSEVQDASAQCGLGRDLCAERIAWVRVGDDNASGNGDLRLLITSLLGR